MALRQLPRLGAGKEAATVDRVLMILLHHHHLILFLFSSASTVYTAVMVGRRRRLRHDSGLGPGYVVRSSREYPQRPTGRSGQCFQ